MKKLACCSILAGVATLFHCGGAANAPIGSGGDGGGGDGTTADAGKDSAGNGMDATGGDGAGSSGGGDGGAEASPGEGGADTGTADTGAGDTGSGDTGSADSGDGDTGSMDTGTVDSGGGDTGATDSSTADSGDGGSSPAALFRVAALMPDPAAVDFCWQQAGGAWNGPVMLGWGISQRLAYQQVTEYVPVPVAATTVRFVAASANDCNASAGEVVFTPPAANAAYLVSSFTAGNVAEQVKAFPDERTTSGTVPCSLLMYQNFAA